MKSLKELTYEIQVALMGAENLGIEWLEKTLSEISGVECSCYDSKISDGADDDESEDSYIMVDCFYLEGTSITIRVYYGVITRYIGYVNVSEN